MSSQNEKSNGKKRKPGEEASAYAWVAGLITGARGNVIIEIIKALPSTLKVWSMIPLIGKLGILFGPLIIILSAAFFYLRWWESAGGSSG